MSSNRKSLSENWLLVEWNSGGRDVVYIRSVVNPSEKDLKLGDRLTVNRRGEQEPAVLVARAHERDVLDAMINKEDVAGPSDQGKQDEEGEDFSSSASDWVPSDDDEQSGDSAEECNEKTKHLLLENYKNYRRQYTNRRTSKKVLTPSNKANAIIHMFNRKVPPKDSDKNTTKMNKSIPDSTKKNQNGTSKPNIDVRDLMNIKNTFNILFSMIEDMKRPVDPALGESLSRQRIETLVKVSESLNQSYTPTNESEYQSMSLDEDKENEEVSEGEEFNRSDDNVLISNKYSNVGVKTGQKKDVGDKEWIPIGSGKTLIHKDKFKKINWRSYTIATRTLLLAVFPRRILATHSLTGKRSPAFQNKPAKMCLDPKIISDVIMEIMDRFNVRENLVRSIITTKCADECKMWKTRSKKKPAKNEENAVAVRTQ